MGVLVYLIIKNLNFKTHGSEEFGLYRGNGYSMTDLIVYDELNNEHKRVSTTFLTNSKRRIKIQTFGRFYQYNDYYKTMDISSLGGNLTNLMRILTLI